jgi:glycosyltransferase involved in cell wall biosynthesis
MRRLVFICPDGLGGVRSYVANLSVFLERAGIDHLILFYGSANGLSTLQTKGDIPHSKKLLFSRYASTPSMYKIFASCINDGDILICNDSWELEAINHLRLQNLVIFMLHGDLKHYDDTLQKNQSFIDHVFCVSTGLKNKYSARFRNLPFLLAHPLVSNFTAAAGQHTKDRLAGVFIGRFEYLKGADVFVEVVKTCNERDLSLTWEVFTTKMASDQKLISALPEQVLVTFDAANEQILTALESMDILVFPSRSEGFGIAVLEAMKRGVIPISRQLPIGIPDMIRDRETGYMADDPGSIVSVIEMLNGDPTLLNKVKQQAMHFSNNTFDYQQTGSKFIQNIERAMDQSAGTGKAFISSKPRIMERILPEPVYRAIKYLHNKIKYGAVL